MRAYMVNYTLPWANLPEHRNFLQNDGGSEHLQRLLGTEERKVQINTFKIDKIPTSSIKSRDKCREKNANLHFVMPNQLEPISERTCDEMSRRYLEKEFQQY